MDNRKDNRMTKENVQDLKSSLTDAIMASDIGNEIYNIFAYTDTVAIADENSYYPFDETPIFLVNVLDKAEIQQHLIKNFIPEYIIQDMLLSPQETNDVFTIDLEDVDKVVAYLRETESEWLPFTESKAETFAMQDEIMAKASDLVY